jgi:hypothetical protein
VIPFVSAEAERFAAESEMLLNLAHRGVRMDAVRVATIYRHEKSKIRPIADTVRFFRMLRRHRRAVDRMRRIGRVRETEGAGGAAAAGYGGAGPPEK